jgi:NADH:ubiquinone oxidoreductase subunit 4 (subunit M)
MVSILGTIICIYSKPNKLESSFKFIIMIFSIIISLYFIFAAFFNTEEKYNSVKMEIQTEIDAFDENQKPASVPPVFHPNLLKTK